MKKILLWVVVINMMLFSACFPGKILSSGENPFFQDDRAVANATFEKVLEALGDNDLDALKSLFSKKALANSEGFDKAANELLDYFQGEFISYDDWGGAVAGSGLQEDGKRRYSIQPTYDVKTTMGEYQFAFMEFTTDEMESDNVGMWSMYVITKDEADSCAYRGSGDWSVSGIFIDVPFDESNRGH